MISVDAATDADLARFAGVKMNHRWMGMSGKRNRLVVGVGGIVEREDGAWRAFLDVPQYAKTPMLFRHALRFMQDVKSMDVDLIVATCDPDVPRSAEFLERLGFVATERTENNMAVWEWRD